MKQIIFFFILWCISCTAYAFPDKPMTMYIPFSEGGTSQQLAEVLVSKILENDNISIKIKTKDPNISVTDYMNSLKVLPNDGYHLIFGNVGTHASNIAINKKAVFYDPIEDFMPIAFVGQTPMFVILREDFPAKNFKEFLTYMRKDPQPKITLAHSGYGSTSYLAGIYLASILKIDPILVPYGGSALALNDMGNGYVDMMVEQSTSVLPFVAGKLVKCIMVTSDNRSTILPDIPTSKEIGLKEFDINGWSMIFVPKGTPLSKVKILNDLFVKALSDKFVQGKFKLSNTIMIEQEKNSYNLLKDFLKSEIDYWQYIVKTFENKIKEYDKDN